MLEVFPLMMLRDFAVNSFAGHNKEPPPHILEGVRFAENRNARSGMVGSSALRDLKKGDLSYRILFFFMTY